MNQLACCFLSNIDDCIWTCPMGFHQREDSQENRIRDSGRSELKNPLITPYKHAVPCKDIIKSLLCIVLDCLLYGGDWLTTQACNLLMLLVLLTPAAAAAGVGTAEGRCLMHFCLTSVDGASRLPLPRFSLSLWEGGGGGGIIEEDDSSVTSTSTNSNWAEPTAAARCCLVGSVTDGPQAEYTHRKVLYLMFVYLYSIHHSDSNVIIAHLVWCKKAETLLDFHCSSFCRCHMSNIGVSECKQLEVCAQCWNLTLLQPWFGGGQIQSTRLQSSSDWTMPWHLPLLLR